MIKAKRSLDLTKVNFFITESYDTVQNITVSDVVTSPSGSLIFPSCLIECGVQSRNKTVYTKREMELAIQDEHILDLLKQKSLLCENGHPSTEDMIAFSQINPSKACCRINRFWFEGNKLMGEIETLNYAKGPELKASILQGVTPSFSLRASGGFRMVEGRKVRAIHVITFDYVVLSSFHNSVANMTNVGGKIGKLRATDTVNMLMEANNVMDYDFLNGVTDIRGVKESQLAMCEASVGAVESIIYDKENNIIGYLAEGAIIDKNEERNSYIEALTESFTNFK